MNHEKSLFETPVAFWSTGDLIAQSPFTNYPWDDEEKPISHSEVSNAIQAGSAGIEPGVFIDGGDPGKDNVVDCTRQEHIERIVWLVKHYDPSKASVSAEHYPNEGVAVNNGYHTLGAAHYNGEPLVNLTLAYGNAAEIQTRLGFNGWKEMPSTAGQFGQDMVSHGNRYWEVSLSSEGDKIWINAQDGENIARAKFKGTFKNYQIGIGDRAKREIGPAASLKAFLRDCSDLIDPVFCEVYGLLIDRHLKNDPYDGVDDALGQAFSA